MSYTKTIIALDYSSVETVIIDPATLLVTSTTLSVDYGKNGVDNTDVNTFTYDVDGVLIGEHYEAYSGDGQLTYQQWTTLEYEGGRLVREREESPDHNEDGNPDNSTLRTITYEEPGRITADEKTYFFDGSQSTTDYRLETFTYGDNGLLDEWRIDDWAFYDFEVGRNYNYDSFNRLTEIQVEDPFKYGDEEYHTEQTWAFNPDGSVSYSNVSGQTEWGFFAELTTKLTYVNANLNKELVEGKDADGVVVFRVLEDTWFDNLGSVTRILTSHDVNLDGKFTPGSQSGYQDFRDIERMTYADINGDGLKEMATHTIDNGLDKVMNYSMVIEDYLVA